jgi:hypothetical protein
MVGFGFRVVELWYCAAKERSATGHASTCQLPTAQGPSFELRATHVGFVVIKVTLCFSLSATVHAGSHLSSKSILPPLKCGHATGVTSWHIITVPSFIWKFISDPTTGWTKTEEFNMEAVNNTESFP